MNHNSRSQSTRSPVRWLFFDVGQTLLDETPAWIEQFGRLSTRLSELHRLVTTEQIRRYYMVCCAAFAPRQWLSIVQHFAPSADDVPHLLALGDSWRHDLEVPFPDAKPTLAELAKHYRLGIIANQSLGTRERMEKHGLLPYLSLVIGSAEAGVAKPDPRIFEEALHAAACKPGEAAMIGDRLDNDIRPANLLGMMTIHVRQGGSGAQRPRDASEIPTASVETLREVTPALIRSLS